MAVTRRQFLGAASGATALTALAGSTAVGQATDDPLKVRNDFPALAEYTFLNTAYIGLIARPVLEAGRAWLDARAHRPLEGGDMLNKTGEARRLFAGIIKSSPEEVALLFSTTEGENVVVNALELKPGDNVVI